MSHLRTIHIGTIKVCIFNDGCIHNNAERMFATAPENDLQDTLGKYELDAEAIQVCFNMAYVDNGEQKILIDTGIGHQPDSPTHGFLYENLDAMGVTFDEIDIVLISHAHADHIACNTDESGHPLFPNARYLIWIDEWRYWTNPETLQEKNLHTTTIRPNLLGIQDRFEMLSYEGEIATGISVVTAFGHTIGHIAVHIQSNNEHLLYTADAFHHPIHIEHPDWVYYSDVDYEQSRESRRKLLNLAANTEAIITGYHMQLPALGYVQRHGDGFNWIALD